MPSASRAVTIALAISFPGIFCFSHMEEQGGNHFHFMGPNSAPDEGASGFSSTVLRGCMKRLRPGLQSAGGVVEGARDPGAGKAHDVDAILSGKSVGGDIAA